MSIWRAQLILMAALALTLSCAHIKPPTGGPLDKEPALIVDSRPADGSTGSGALEEVTITFGEPVNRGSVLEALHVSPKRLIRSVRWSGDTLLAVRFWQALPADASVDLFLKPGWRDLHGVEQPEWQAVSFATGDSLLAGWLGGQVTFKGSASRSMHLRLRDETGVLERSGRPDRGGSFLFRHLPADGRSWILTAFQDVDGDSLFDPAVDFADSLTDTLVLDNSMPRRMDLAIDVIDPFEPGEIAGSLDSGVPDSLRGPCFIRLLPDSFRLADGERPLGAPGALPESLLAQLAPRLVWSAEGDSLRPAGERIKVQGSFGFDRVPPGDWWLFAHMDMGVEDSLWNPALEPAYIDPGPRTLSPDATLSWPRFRLTLPVDSTAVDSLTVEADSTDTIDAPVSPGAPR